MWPRPLGSIQITKGWPFLRDTVSVSRTQTTKERGQTSQPTANLDAALSPLASPLAGLPLSPSHPSLRQSSPIPTAPHLEGKRTEMGDHRSFRLWKGQAGASRPHYPTKKLMTELGDSARSPPSKGGQQRGPLPHCVCPTDTRADLSISFPTIRDDNPRARAGSPVGAGCGPETLPALEVEEGPGAMVGEFPGHAVLCLHAVKSESYSNHQQRVSSVRFLDIG